MSSMENVADLSKYILTLPKTRVTFFITIFSSFIIGCLGYITDPSLTSNILDLLIYGGSIGFFIFGLSSLMSGVLTQTGINSIRDSVYMKTNQSMFLSFITMLIIGITFIVGVVISTIFGVDQAINFLILGCALGFAFRTLVLWGVSNISLFDSSLTASIQPILLLSFYIIIQSLSTVPYAIQSSFIWLFLKVFISCLIFLLAIYSFVKTAESPMKKNIGLSGIELLSLFVSQLTSGSMKVEKLFIEFGEPIETLTGLIIFKNKKGEIKNLFLSPCVHPGPLGNLGGGNMPKILADKFPFLTMVSHGPSTHDFNPVSTEEIDKIENVVKESLDDLEYNSNVSEFRRFTHEDASIGVQMFGNDMLMLATFAPSEVDDIEFGVGLALMNLAKSKKGVENAILVDCHNSFKPESGRILAGNREVFQLMDAVEKIEIPEKLYSSIKIGCAYDDMEGFTKDDGLGPAGLKVMITEVNNQKMAYILFDSNNMEMGYRAKIMEAVEKLGIDEIEVMTSDTHSVNTLSKGYNPVGLSKKEEIIEKVLETCEKALDDLEEVEVASKVLRISDIHTFGPNHSTELISTISSILAFSKIIAPIVFFIAIIIVIWWIFSFKLAILI